MTASLYQKCTENDRLICATTLILKFHIDYDFTLTIRSTGLSYQESSKVGVYIQDKLSFYTGSSAFQHMQKMSLIHEEGSLPDAKVKHLDYPIKGFLVVFLKLSMH